MMFKAAFKAKHVLNKTLARIPEIDFIITMEDWNRCNIVSKFLEAAASIMENHLGCNHVTLSFTFKNFAKGVKACQIMVLSDDTELHNVAESMVQKLKS